MDINRRQDLPRLFALNGAVYFSNCIDILESKRFINSDTIGYEMGEKNSIDIDNKLDFFICEQIFLGNIV